MEPKSIAFYTAVAIGILAVMTNVNVMQTYATVAEQELEEQAASADDDSTTENESATDDVSSEDETEPKKEADPRKDNSAKNNEARNNDNDEATNQNEASQSLGLTPSNGVASCGDVIMNDITLQADLNCSGDGLVVGESGITINLNGYTINSNDEDDSIMNYDGNSGILVPNADDVTILGLGQITGFDSAIRFTGSSGGQVADLSLNGNDVGVLMSGSEDIEISQNTINNNGYAIVSESSNEAVIAFNQIVANEEQGILLLGSSENAVAGNNMFGNGANGLYLDAQSSLNTVDYNNIFGHEEADINNADGLPTHVNQNSFGENNNCGTSLPGGLC